MSRMLVYSAILLAAFSISSLSLRADEPKEPAPAKPKGPGNPPVNNLVPQGQIVPDTSASSRVLTLGNNSVLTTLSGTISNAVPAPTQNVPDAAMFNDAAPANNAYSGVGAVNAGVLTVTNDAVNWSDANGGETSFTLGGYGGPSTVTAPRLQITPIPKGPVFYIITEGAGMGDAVRTVPCTGSETVMSAVGAIGGISQVSGKKIWIARPTQNDADKSTIVPVDWEAISRRGINTTNYKLMPGDRLVFGEDPQMTQSNLLSKKTAPVERINGVIGLTASTLHGMRNTPGAGKLVEELIDKGFITEDRELRKTLLDAIHGAEESKKSEAKPVEPPLTVPGAEKPDSAAANVAPSTDFLYGGLPQLTPPAPLHVNAAPSNGFLYLGYRSSDQGRRQHADYPHEFAMRPLPAYRIEPPDVIAVEMLKMVPKPPYRAAIFDVLQIRANAPPDQPIDNYYMVEADGSIDLGPQYGKVRVAGKTLSEINSLLDKHLRQYLNDPKPYSQLARVSGAQPVTGQYLVAPDGTINLRKYGSVQISGMSAAEAKAAIENRLKEFLDTPEVSVDVTAAKSKVYFVITQGAGLGDSVRRLPSTGKETVLDAISQINGLSQVSDSKKIWIVRPSPSDPQKATVLKVDWHAITRRGETATNYQILPRDRVYIGEDAQLTGTNLIAKNTAPLERAMGVISLTTSTLQSMSGSPGGAAAVKELVKRGVFDSDPQVKRIVEETIRLGEEEGKKAAAKPPSTTP
jgi:polysaccharide export outer membrane protein